MKIPRSLSAELRSFIAEIEHCIDVARDPKRWLGSAPDVSGWSVADHLEHLAAADAGILDWLQQVASGAASKIEGHPTLVGRLVLLVGAIPRGKGKAPVGTTPAGRDPETLDAELNRVRSMATGLEEKTDRLATSRATRRHHVFGHLNPYQWIRFAHIHHLHHRRIVEDILRASV